jgi:hypothetical protein
METYKKNIAALQDIEAKLMEAVCRLQTLQHDYDRWQDGSDWKVHAGKRLMPISIEVRNLRRDYAQAVMNAYATGITTNGQILWS